MKTKNLFPTILALLIISGSLMAQEIETSSKPLRINLSAKDVTAPDIFLSYRNGGAINVRGKVDVDITIIDKGGVAFVSVNNEKIRTQTGDSILFSMSFNQGDEVSVTAKDNFNNVKEKSFIIKGQIVQLVKNGPAPRRFFALLMGVEDYTDPAITPLSEPIQDATLLKKVLVERYTFDEKDVTLIKNPTFEDLNVAMEDLSHNVGPEDFLLIFYAGHGYFDEKTNIGYWLPADAQQKVHAKWFRNSALVEDIGAINSKHTLLIADACFSGGIFKTRAPFNNASPEIADMIRRPSRKAMTSGSLTTVPDKSIFMRYLLKSLNENENKYLPSEDLFDDIRISMKNNSTTKPLYGEIQNVGDEGGVFVFIRR